MDNIVEQLEFDSLEDASAVLYAAARRFCISYEDLAFPDDDKFTLRDMADDLCRAAGRFAEALTRWQAQQE